MKEINDKLEHSEQPKYVTKYEDFNRHRIHDSVKEHRPTSLPADVQKVLLIQQIN